MSPPRCRFCPTTIKRSEINIHGEISIGPDRFIYPPGRGSRPREQDSERRSLAKLSTVRETDSRPRGKDSLGIADRTRQCLRERVRQRPSVPQPVSPPAVESNQVARTCSWGREGVAASAERIRDLPHAQLESHSKRGVRSYVVVIAARGIQQRKPHRKQQRNSFQRRPLASVSEVMRSCLLVL